MKVTAILKGRVDSNNQVPIQIRVAIGNKRQFHPTHIKVEKAQFQKGRVINHPKAAEYNLKIKNRIIQLQAQSLEGFTRKYPKTDFYAYTTKLLREWDSIKDSETLEQITVQVKKIREFAPSLYLHEITHEFLNSYKAHRRQQVKSENTVWNSFKHLRLILNRAVKDKLIAESPFKDFEMPKYKNAKKVYLTKEELLKLETYILKDCPKDLFHYGVWFLISCRTGFRGGDMLRFNRKENIVQGRLIVHTQKTGEIVSMPMNEKLEQYFSLVDYKPLDCIMNTYRLKVKEIAKLAKITKDINIHTSRHTFGTLAVSSGIPLDFVSKMMGHRNIATTSIYAKIMGSALDQEWGKVME